MKDFNKQLWSGKDKKRLRTSWAASVAFPTQLSAGSTFKGIGLATHRCRCNDWPQQIFLELQELRKNLYLLSSYAGELSP